ncbi:MAG: YggS family pyridoxal phosphate-dependent enzyme [Pyrinomonadaceae bacterium]
MQTDIKANLMQLRRRITKAAKRAGRNSKEIKLVAVSKMHSASAAEQAIACKVIALGENKVQEAEGKIGDVGRNATEWHLIGHLQSNKARKAVQLFDVIQSLDSPELAHRLERICEEEGRSGLSVLAQVDLAGEESKSGILETKLPMLVETLARCQRISFDGLMALPPFFEDPEETRPYFERLRLIRDRLTEEGAFRGKVGELSMGMTHDLEVAIEEGATIIRVGTAIFGTR